MSNLKEKSKKIALATMIAISGSAFDAVIDPAEAHAKYSSRIARTKNMQATTFGNNGYTKLLIWNVLVNEREEYQTELEEQISQAGIKFDKKSVEYHIDGETRHIYPVMVPDHPSSRALASNILKYATDDVAVKHVDAGLIAADRARNLDDKILYLTGAEILAKGLNDPELNQTYTKVVKNKTKGLISIYDKYMNDQFGQVDISDLTENKTDILLAHPVMISKNTKEWTRTLDDMDSKEFMAAWKITKIFFDEAPAQSETKDKAAKGLLLLEQIQSTRRDIPQLNGIAHIQGNIARTHTQMNADDNDYIPENKDLLGIFPGEEKSLFLSVIKLPSKEFIPVLNNNIEWLEKNIGKDEYRVIAGDILRASSVLMHAKKIKRDDMHDARLGDILSSSGQNEKLQNLAKSYINRNKSDAVTSRVQ